MLGLETWVTITPPSEQWRHGMPTQPFGTDYVAWERAVAALSRRYPVLTALVIDDFDVNRLSFPDTLLGKMRAVRDSVGSSLPLYAVIYRRTVDSLQSWWHSLSPYLDGVVFAYDDFNSTDSLPALLRGARADLSLGSTLAVNIYVTGGPRAPSPRRATSYLGRALQIADSMATVVRLYCLPKDPSDSLVQSVNAFMHKVRDSTPPR